MDTAITNPTLEMLCERYRAARDQLHREAADVAEVLEAVKRDAAPILRSAVLQAAAIEAELRGAVRDSPDGMWVKKRTRTIHGIKVGWTKKRGNVVIQDEAKTVKRIEEQLPPEQAQLLIRTRKSVHKPAVYDLIAADLRRLGIAIEDDCDEVVVRDVEGEIDRLLEGLIAAATAEIVEGT